MLKSNWTPFLGLWLIATALSFSSNSLPITISDIVAGGLILVFHQYRWVLALIGVWLQFAPLVFWAPNEMSYINDTLVGAMVVAFAVLLLRDPDEEKKRGGEVPPGWSYNPSSWTQRVPIIFLAFLAWMFARYMAAYQLGYIDNVIDPVFGDGTLKVITSKVSKAFPVADAGLGAMAYTLEMLMGIHGSTRRWHTIPWFVILFAILVVPLGFTSIVLIMLQPILVGYWCFWCLLTAVCMLFMIALAIDEVIAVLHCRKEGEKAQMMTRPDSVWYGVSFPWNLWVTAALGIWLMFSPQFLGEKGTVADLDHIIGALTVTFSIISMAEVVRSARFAITVFGLIALSLSFFSISHIIPGIGLILLSLPRGKIYERYGSWDQFIK